MKVKIEVKLKKGYFDPEGEVVAISLRDLGFSLKSVRVSKVYTIDMDVNDVNEGIKKAQEMCRKLLANPVKDDFSIEVLSDEDN
jgi:phosphoribosylformylglycinamidine synthase